MNIKEASCQFNSMIICPKQGRNCDPCGWYPKEIKRRKARIDSGDLALTPKGRQYLLIKKGDR